MGGWVGGWVGGLVAVSGWLCGWLCRWPCGWLAGGVSLAGWLGGAWVAVRVGASVGAEWVTERRSQRRLRCAAVGPTADGGGAGAGAGLEQAGLDLEQGWSLDLAGWSWAGREAGVEAGRSRAPRVGAEASLRGGCSDQAGVTADGKVVHALARSC